MLVTSALLGTPARVVKDDRRCRTSDSLPGQAVTGMEGLQPLTRGREVLITKSFARVENGYSKVVTSAFRCVSICDIQHWQQSALM